MHEIQPAITKEDLTEKELFCIARHLKRYVEVLIHNHVDFPDPCSYCPHGHACSERRFAFAWETLLKLSNITGIHMSPMRCKNPNY